MHRSSHAVGGESQPRARIIEVPTSLGLRGPFVICLRGRIPRPAGYPARESRTSGEHLKKARHDRGVPQRRHPAERETARAIGCNPLTFLNWEKGRLAPDARFWPKILTFLGYDPRPEPEGFPGRIRAARNRRSWRWTRAALPAGALDCRGVAQGQQWWIPQDAVQQAESGPTLAGSVPKGASGRTGVFMLRRVSRDSWILRSDRFMVTSYGVDCGGAPQGQQWMWQDAV